MKSLVQNPFRPTRWEHQQDGQQLIWYTDTADELVAEKSVFVYGSRGSGKTTLLRGICWEDLTQNQSLRLQKRVTDFDHLGVYIRFPDHISASFSEKVWGKPLANVNDPEFEFHRIFSLLIESACIERLLECLHELRILGDLDYQPSSELMFVDDLLSEFPKIRDFGEVAPRTFSDLARTFRSMARSINQSFGRGAIEELWQELPLREPYELLGYACERLSGSVKLRSQVNNRSPRFKFCFDDCEALDLYQRKSLNSLVRQSRAPVSWVIASVGKSQWAGETYINSQPLTDADRAIISLDRREAKDFSSLCEAVASMRLLFSLPDGEQPNFPADKMVKYFDLSERLGRQDVNSIMEKMISRSSKPFARDVEASAKVLQSAQKELSRQSRKEPSLPLYEAYVLMHWGGSETAFKPNYVKIDEDMATGFAAQLMDTGFSAWLRRKQVNALLQFSAKLSQKRLPICGSNYVVSLADGSIRDFLEILGEIYEEYVNRLKTKGEALETLVRFANSRTKISDETQTRGIYRASEAYFEGISNRFDVEGDLLTRLVSGLGYLTSFLQSNPSDSRVLAFAERGIFLFSPPKNPNIDTQMVEDVRRALKQAELAGYLRPIATQRMPRKVSVRTDVSVLAYRLHKRFSPNFRFSFRGAYEPFRLEFSELFELLINTDRGASLRWAEKMGGIADRFNDEQFTLPLEERTDDEL
ncbi:hypothetical protein UM399_07575 [Sulfitobacter pontiacus]|uniref:ORC-CDC6 family AAA ATPase n=1 Tax=Sulfitobacter pontiacus TaxID=60137 RepID=UPI002AC94ECE|nr:hypothetical protein [Sulfitobacter pontiacus]WPZ24058.1 hypothetical protein UM399_07575 [Sulfitobacter pontiacus]